jgi:hypothetical protein
MLVGVPVLDAAWLAVARATVPDASDLMPVVDPAVAGNLVTQAADGTLVDAGYTATSIATGSSVPRRDSGGTLVNDLSQMLSNADGVHGGSVAGVGLFGFSEEGIGVKAQGPTPLRLGNVAEFDSGGVLRFLGASADTNRAFMRTEIGALPLDANVTAARTSGYTFQSSDRGAVIPVSGTFTFSLPDGMPTGAQAVLVRTGAGTVTISAATTLVSDGTQMTTNGAVTVIHLGSNVWYAFGKLS